MTKDQLAKIHDRENKETIRWGATCHDCGCSVCVSSTEQYADDEKLNVTGYRVDGGAVYLTNEIHGHMAFKCPECYAKDPVLRRYQDNTVFSRIVGYLQPVAGWNDAKQAEFNDRRMFQVPNGL